MPSYSGRWRSGRWGRRRRARTLEPRGPPGLFRFYWFRLSQRGCTHRRIAISGGRDHRWAPGGSLGERPAAVVAGRRRRRQRQALHLATPFPVPPRSNQGVNYSPWAADLRLDRSFRPKKSLKTLASSPRTTTRRSMVQRTRRNHRPREGYPGKTARQSRPGRARLEGECTTGARTREWNGTHQLNDMQSTRGIHNKYGADYLLKKAGLKLPLKPVKEITGAMSFTS